MRRIFVGAAVLLGLGCDHHRPHPWDQPDAAAAPVSTALPSLGLPPPLATGADPAPSGSAAPSGEPAGVPATPVRVGGPWVRCYGDFHPAGDPVKDVTRLSVLCGPENGMKRLSRAPLQGALTEGGPSVTETFEARRGECYRVFAVAERGVTDLDVVVRSSRGAAIAADHGEDAWPIVQPDRPFCALEDDRYTVDVSTRHGSGRFAAEVWVLRTPTPRRP